MLTKGSKQLRNGNELIINPATEETLLAVLAELGGTPATITPRSFLNIAKIDGNSRAFFIDETVAVGKKLVINAFTAGGKNNGSAVFARHFPNTITLFANGGLNNSGDIAGWTFSGAGSFVLNTNPSFIEEGAGSGQVNYTNSKQGTPIIEKVFNPTLDITDHRFIRAGFYNDSITTNRTVRITLFQGAGKREYDKTTGFSPDAFHLIEFDIDKPTSKTGVVDPTAIDKVWFQVLDSVSNAGTVYWDRLGLRDQVSNIAKVYFTSQSTRNQDFNPSRIFNAGESFYVILINDTGNVAEFSAFLQAFEQNA